MQLQHLISGSPAERKPHGAVAAIRSGKKREILFDVSGSYVQSGADFQVSWVTL